MAKGRDADHSRIGDALMQDERVQKLIEEMGLHESSIDAPSLIAHPDPRGAIPRGTPHLRIDVEKLTVHRMAAKDGTLEIHIQLGPYRVQIDKFDVAGVTELGRTFTVPLGDAQMVVDASTFFTDPYPLHVVLISESCGVRSTVGTGIVNWRRALTDKACSVALNLRTSFPGPSQHEPTATVALRLMTENITRLPEDRYDVLNGMVKQQVSSATSAFHRATEKWWSSFRAAWATKHTVTASIDKRRVPLAELGEEGNIRPILSIIYRIPANFFRHTLPCPEDVHRFISLMPEVTTPQLGGGRHVVWETPHTILARGSGDVEAHSVLLAAMLLGFGCDAYIVIGDSENGSTAWVMTIDIDQPGDPLFWEPCASVRHQWSSVRASPSSMGLRSIDCVFNNEKLFVNFDLQSTLHSGMSFDFTDKNHWKELSLSTLAPFNESTTALSLPPASPPRLLPTLPHPAVGSTLWRGGPLTHRPVGAGWAGATEAALAIERGLMARVDQRRADGGLTTQWDDALSGILGATLHSYEMERVVGMPVPTPLMGDLLKRHMSRGQQFQAVPLGCGHVDPDRMFSLVVRNSYGKGIMDCTQQDAAFGVAARVFVYGEAVFGVWILLGVKFYP